MGSAQYLHRIRGLLLDLETTTPSRLRLMEDEVVSLDSFSVFGVIVGNGIGTGTGTGIRICST